MTTIPKSIVLIILVFSGLTACNNVKTQASDPVTPTDSIDAASFTKHYADDTTNYDETIFPVDSQFQLKVLTTGVFHEDEVWENADKENWYGLFKASDGFYLEQTQIKTQRVNDPILDETEDEKTGWEVTTSQNDTSYILIEALPYLQKRSVQHVSLSKHHLYPGDTIGFSFLGTDYKLFAEGRKKKVQEDPEVYDVTNYKLYITATKGSQRITQLLVAQPSFDDTMIEVLFAGDIDGDGILDLIIDTSGHYNVTSPTLYLSKPAGEKELVKPVGGHTSVGC